MHLCLLCDLRLHEDKFAQRKRFIENDCIAGYRRSIWEKRRFVYMTEQSIVQIDEIPEETCLYAAVGSGMGGS